MAARTERRLGLVPDHRGELPDMKAQPALERREELGAEDVALPGVCRPASGGERHETDADAALLGDAALPTA